MPSSSNDDKKILELKRKALACKREGDIESAKTYLRQAKQLEQSAAATDGSTKEDESPAEPNAPTQALTSNPPDKEDHNREEDIEEEQDTPRYEDPVNKAIDEANLEELEHKDVRFTDKELIDYEAMQDMRDIMSEHFPTEAFYQERIVANKRAALEKKQANDIPAAKQRLMTAKQLEKAHTVLFKNAQTNNKDEDDGEDYSLLDELFAGDNTRPQNDDDNDGFFEQLFGKSATVLELDDLDDMDAALLKDMMDAGMQVPSVEDVLQSAEERKMAAVAFKKDGNLEAAKAALLESKRFMSKANQLSSLLQAIANGVSQDDDPELALGDMLKADVEQKRPPTSQEAAPTKKLLFSAEYREQAVQQKQLGNKDAAIAALRLYKEALAVEEKAKSAAQKKEWILELQKEAVLASEQAGRFVYYSRFVDKEVGSKMIANWRLYAQTCLSYAKGLDTGVGSSVTLPIQRRIDENGLHIISDCALTFVGTSCDPRESRIETSILELINLQNNKRLREQHGLMAATDPGGLDFAMPDAGSIRVVVTIHLPSNVEVADDSVQTLTFTANSLRDDNKTYVFGQSQYIHAERGFSRFAKQFVRRLARRRCVAVEVFYSRTIAMKGMFSTSSKTEEILLGSAGLELTALQEKNCIAIDLPLLEARREVGGSVRLAIRSGSPFFDTPSKHSDDPKEESTETTSLGQNSEILESYAQLVFPY